MTVHPRVIERRSRGVLSSITGGNVLEVGLLAVAVACVIATIVATVRVGQSGDTSDLAFEGTLGETSSLIANRGASGVATHVHASLSVGRISLVFDSLAVSGDSTSFPALAKGGFLRDQIDLFNDHAARVAVRDVYRRGLEASIASAPSLFRLARTDSGYHVLSSILNAYALTIPSPRRDRQGVTIQTADGHAGPSLVGVLGTVDLSVPDSLLTTPRTLSGAECRMQRRHSARLLYCGSAAGSAVGAAYDLGIELPDSAVIGIGTQARMSRSTALYVNGVRSNAPASIKSGDLLYTRMTGPMVLSSTASGILAGPQWLNGRRAFTVAREGTIEQLGRVGRGVNSPSGSLTVSFDGALAGELDARIDAFMTQHDGLLEEMSVVIADIGSGEVRALAQSGARTGESLRAFEPMLLGSMVKPILAAAILAQDPSLANMTLTWAGEEATSIAGMKLRVPFRNPPNGCGSTITFTSFLACSSNQYAAELFIRSLQRSAGKQVLTQNGVVPNTLLENTPLTNGLLTLFDDIDVVSNRDPGRTDRIWRYASGSAEFIPVDRSAHPWKSRPWYIESRAGSGGTSLDLLARFAFGGWENRWTQLGVAEAYARIATDRRVHLTVLRQPRAVAKFTPMSPTEAQALGAVRRGLAAVAEYGTAAGIAQTFKRIGTANDSLVVLAKTGTLNEVTARSSDDGVYLKSLAIVVGRRESANASAPLTCGAVAVVHLEFRQDWRRAQKSSATLPNLHRTFAERELAPALSQAWKRLATCPVQPD